MTDPGILAHLRTRDPSLCLAVAALLRIADEHGSAAFGALAVAYREDYLAVLRRVAGDTARGDSGTLSVDDVRRHLAVSVLPRLATEALIEVPLRAWADAEVVRMAPAVWRAFEPEAEGHRLLLLETAYGGMLLHTTGEHPTQAATPAGRGSLLEGTGLTKTYGRRAVVKDVDVRVRQGEIVGLLGS